MTDSEKLDLLLTKMSNIEDKVSGIENKVSGIENKVSGIENKVSGIENKVSGIENKMSGMESDLSEVKHKITKVEMTLENEVTVNIMRVAEGHIALSRNLSEVKRSVESLDSKMEINDLYIRYHDSEIKKLKMV